MGNVISITAVRVERVRQVLTTYGGNGEPVDIVTPNGRVAAERLICRECFVEVLDNYGNYFVIDYNDVVALHPAAVAQTSVVNARGEFLPSQNVPAVPRQVTILPFERRSSRKQSVS
jgi:hypothetical protein